MSKSIIYCFLHPLGFVRPWPDVNENERKPATVRNEMLWPCVCRPGSQAARQPGSQPKPGTHTVAMARWCTWRKHSEREAQMHGQIAEPIVGWFGSRTLLWPGPKWHAYGILEQKRHSNVCAICTGWRMAEGNGGMVFYCLANDRTGLWGCLLLSGCGGLPNTYIN